MRYMTIISLTFIVIIIFCIDITNALSGQRVVESSFCLQLELSECTIPYVTDSISISQIKTTKNGKKVLYFWTKISVDEDKNIMHVWSAEGREDKWAEPVHVSWSDKIRNLAFEIVAQTKDFLRIIHNSNPGNHSVQGVILAINKSPRFRTYSSILAKPGKYTIGVYDLNRNIIPGGEPKTIEVLP